MDLKIAFGISSALSAALTLYIAFEEYRKREKQKLKAEKKRLKLELSQKMNSEKESDVPKSGAGETIQTRLL